MAIEKRGYDRLNAQGSLTGAPYMAKIISHLDSTFQGGLEVSLLRESGNQIADDNQTYVVKYASPFYGSTSYEFSGKNVTYEDSQLSYGFWAMPPDVGVTGIVIFIDGDPTLGFWVACIQDKFQNHMVPAIGGSKNFETSDDYKQGEHPLPVVEHNRKANELDKNLEIDKINRAVHPIAKRFLKQGLTRDEFRGTSSSTSRRDVPNMVFGMSTPGPLDRLGKKKFIGKRENQTPTPVPIQRLGGSQFVMDDGDDRYYREKTPSEGPPTYLKFIPDQLGNMDIPYNEHFRIRTRTGHQILLNNSEDLIYIGNARGTAWIEISSDGKIDVFSADSINLRTKTDFNFFCDRDFNIEVGRNFNTKVRGEMHTQVGKDNVLIVDRDQKIYIKRRKDETIIEQYRQTVSDEVKKFYGSKYTHNVNARMDFRVGSVSFTSGLPGSAPGFAPYDATDQNGNNPCSNDAGTSIPVQDVNGEQPNRIDIKLFQDVRIQYVNSSVDVTVDGSLKLKAKGSVDVRTDSTYKQTSKGNLEILSGGSILSTSAGTNETLAGGNIIETSPGIYMNEGASAAASSVAAIASLPVDARVSARATIPLPLSVHKMPDIKLPDPAAEPIELVSIVRRLPTYEPYPHHENLYGPTDKPMFKPTNLDRDVAGRYNSETQDLFSPPPDWKKYKKPGDNPF